MTRTRRNIAAFGVALLSLAPVAVKAQPSAIIAFARTIAVPSFGTAPFALSRDGRLLATSGADGATHVYATANMHAIATLAHPKNMYALAFSPDGALLLCSGDGAIAWSTLDWRVRWSLPSGTYLEASSFAPDGQTLFTAANSQLLARAATSGAASADASVRLGSTPVSAIAVANGGALVAAGSSGGGLRVIALPERTVTAIADKTAYAGRLTAAERAGSLAHPGHIAALAFSSDDALLASSGGDGTIKLWRLRPWNPPFEKPAWRFVCGGNTESLVFEKGDRILDAGCGRAILRIDVRTGVVRASLRSHDDDVEDIAAEPDGEHLWSGALDRTLKRWDLASGSNVATYGQIDTAALSVDGRTFAFGRGDDAIELFDPTTDRKIATLRGHFLPLTLGSYSYSRATLALSRDGAYVAGGGYITEGFVDHTGVAGGVARVWRRASVQPLRTWTGVAPETLTFSDDGLRLAARSPAMSDTPDTVWSASLTSPLASVWKPHMKSAGFCQLGGFTNSRASFNPAPALLLAFGDCTASGNAPARLTFWRIGSLAPEAPFPGEPIDMALLALSADGHRVLSVGAKVTLWDTVARHALAAAPLEPLGKNESIRSVALGGGLAVGLVQTDMWRESDRYRYALAIWDVRTGRQLARTGPRPIGERGQLLLSGDGTRAYVTTPAGIDVWGLKSGPGAPIP